MLVKLIRWLVNTRMGVPLKGWYLRLTVTRTTQLITNLKKEEDKLSSPDSVKKIPPQWQEEVAALRQEFNKKFSRFVVWGLRDDPHTHRFIHRAYYFTAKRLGIPTVWLKNTPENNKLLLPGDLVTVMGSFGSWWNDGHIKPLPDIRYYLYYDYSQSFVAQLKKEQYLSWQEYKLSRIAAGRRPDMTPISSDEGLFYNPKLRILIQPYGTDLLPWEFMSPVCNPHQKKVNYVGTLWGENEEAMRRFARYVRSVGLKLNLVETATLAEQIELIRQSRLAPSISGMHASDNYPPCRMYKNISYGQLGYGNVPIHQNLYKDCHPPVGSIEEMSDYVLRMSEDDYIAMTRAQQKITQRFTFLQGLMNIFKYF